MTQKCAFYHCERLIGFSCHFDRSVAEWRNLAGNWVDLSVRDQIPPLRDATLRSGRNDKMRVCLFRRIIAVFLKEEQSKPVPAKAGGSNLRFINSPTIAFPQNLTKSSRTRRVVGVSFVAFVLSKPVSGPQLLRPVGNSFAGRGCNLTTSARVLQRLAFIGFDFNRIQAGYMFITLLRKVGYGQELLAHVGLYFQLAIDIRRW